MTIFWVLFKVRLYYTVPNAASVDWNENELLIGAVGAVSTDLSFAVRIVFDRVITIVPVLNVYFTVTGV